MSKTKTSVEIRFGNYFKEICLSVTELSHGNSHLCTGLNCETFRS
jgi:hypothetical protein